MSIKKDAYDRFFSRNDTQRELAELLDEAFDVTFGNQFGGLYLWILEPKNNVSERFGFQKEIVTLYSPHAKTDARTLKNIELISLSPEFKHRIDKVVAIIIHEGDQKEAEELFSQTNDWIIIPIQADELRNKNKGALFIRSKLASKIGNFDLFGMSSPIKNDKYFYGRDPLVQELIQRTTVRKENSGVFGLRKTGKTSVLFALQRRLVEKDILCEYIDCQGPGIYGGRWWQLLEEISFRLIQSTEQKHQKTIKTKGNFDQTNAANTFNRLIKSILEINEINQISLLLDEIEFITPGISNSLGQHWDADFVPFWQTIRSTSQEVSGNLSFVVAGVNPSSVEQPHFEKIQNPIFQLAIPFYLDPMEKDDVREMIRTIGKYSGFSFEEDCYSLLKENYGGHPYLIRLACSETIKSKNSPSLDKKVHITTNDFIINKIAIQNRLSQPIKDILLSLIWWYPDEYDLLLMLAAGEKKFYDEYTGTMPVNTIQFVKYGLVHSVDNKFAIQDLQDFLTKFGDGYKETISPFKRGDLPPENLPPQPNLNDLAILFEKRTEVEIALRKYIILIFGYKTGFNDKDISEKIIKSLDKRDGRNDQTQLFVGRRPQDAINELFLSDLKPIFRKNWDDFSPIFEKNQQRFDMNMDTINIARRYEAHAKPIYKIDKEEFMNSYSWFTSRLNKVPGLL